MPQKRLTLYTDGASRGNPGPAAIGVVILGESGKRVATISECLDACTNNQAEYRAVIAGLEKALAMSATDVLLCSDSELVTEQLKGNYKVKNIALKPLYDRATALSRRLKTFVPSCIPREKNREADRLANQALDGKKRQEPPAAGIGVRSAARADYAAIIEIIEELEKQHIEAVPQFFCKESYSQQVHDLDSILAEKDSALLVAENDSVIAGYIHLALQKSEDHPGIVARCYVKIRDLAVSNKHQKAGAGTALMQAAERWAKEHGIDTLELNVWEFNRGAFAFYQKMGYTTASRHMWKKI